MFRRYVLAFGLVSLALVLASCGGDSDTNAAPDTTAASVALDAAPDTTAAPVALDAPTIEAVADTLGCVDYEQSSEAAPFVDEWGTCQLDGSPVKLYLIPDDDQYEQFVDAAAAYGAQESWLVRDGDVVVAPDDQTQLDQIRAAVS